MLIDEDRSLLNALPDQLGMYGVVANRDGKRQVVGVCMRLAKAEGMASDGRNGFPVIYRKLNGVWLVANIA